MELVVDAAQGREVVVLKDPLVVLAAFTGRDTEAVRTHVEELGRHGIAPPKTTPMYYRVPPHLLVMADRIEVLGGDTSGEVEPVLIITGGREYLGLGSDHTDRKAEALSIPLAKQLGPKVLSPVVWPVSEVADEWDGIQVVSRIDGEELYQEGALGHLLPPSSLAVDRFRVPGRDLVMFMGTFPTRGGIRPSSIFSASMARPGQHEPLALRYQIVPFDGE